MINFVLGVFIGFAFYPVFNRWVKPVLTDYLDQVIKKRKQDRK
jgi:hypothetical protein